MEQVYNRRGFVEHLAILGGVSSIGAGSVPSARRASRAAAFSRATSASRCSRPRRGVVGTRRSSPTPSARRLAVTVRPYRATTLPALGEAFDALVRDGMEGLVGFQGGLSVANRQRIADFATTHRRPAIYQSEFFVEAGGLMAWAPDQEEQYREAARYVDRILRGAKPGDLPVRYPGRYALILDTQAARAIGLTLSPALIAQAARVLR